MCEAGETPEGTEVIHLAPLADLLVSIERQLRYGHYCSSKSLKLLSAQKTCRLGIMKMMQISQNIPFPALVLCSSAQLEPAVNAGQRPAASLRTAFRPCDGERAQEQNGEQPPASSSPRAQARHEPHRAARPFSSLTLGTRLESPSPCYWELFIFF